MIDELFLYPLHAIFFHEGGEEEKMNKSKKTQRSNVVLMAYHG